MLPVPVGLSACGSVALVTSPRGAWSLVPLLELDCGVVLLDCGLVGAL